MKLIKKAVNKLKAGAWFPFYNAFYEYLQLDGNLILFESRSGNALEGNILRILEELSKEDYAGFKKVLAVRKNARTAIREKLRRYQITGVRCVKTGTIRYYYYLSKAGWLVNDTSFPGRFIKKDGQVYLNTWHGTPLKKMGLDNQKERYSMGNVMRNLVQSDYLVFPNSYMEERMAEAYQLRNLYHGTILREGYPRNDVFFRAEEREKLRRELGFGDKQIILYVPTFRGKVDAIDSGRQCRELVELLAQVDRGLKDRQKMYVKLHPLMNEGIDTASFCHIEMAPPAYDVNDLLNAADVLVTDYSSIFYDFANTDRKIILFAYDEEAYCAARGIYEPLDSYPFPKVTDVDGLLEALNDNSPEDRTAFRTKYATYESGKAAERICSRVFLGQAGCREHQFCGNGRENILIYAGDLEKNGITTALFTMLSGLDKTRFNYYLSFRKSSLEKAPDRLGNIPEQCGLIPLASEINMDVGLMLAQWIYFHQGPKYRFVRKKLEKSYRREWRKHFGTIEFRHVVHYNGYERYVISLLQYYHGIRTIWVHNDMLGEIKQKGNQNLYQLRDAYRAYDHVVVVSQDIYQSTQSISRRTDNIQVIGNCHDYRRVRELADSPLRFDSDTETNVSLERLERILEDDSEKFINIGRYSPEKGHQRLIQAFEKYWTEHKSTYLIIIGGTGGLYQQTKMWAEESAAKTHIILIRSMKNPMPVLKKCQLFILSSLYEGLGLVMLEADSLGIPVVACDVAGPAGFMRKYGGTLVADSMEGIYEGMLKYSRGEVSCINIDYAKLNQENLRKCENLW